MATQIEVPPSKSPRTAAASPAPARAPLTEEMLLRFQERASVYDQENRFFTEDFEELRASGYLLLAVPKELGGLGMSLAEIDVAFGAYMRRVVYEDYPIQWHLSSWGGGSERVRGDTGGRLRF